MNFCKMRVLAIMHRFSLNRKPVRILIIAGSVLAILTVVTLFWLSRNLTRLIETTLQKNLGPDFSLGSIEAGWNRVVLTDVRIRRGGPGPFPHRLLIPRLVLTPSFRALASRRIEIKQLTVERPQVLIEIGPDGKVIAPLPATQKQHTAVPEQGNSPAFSTAIGKIELTDGELIILDRHSKRRAAVGISNPKDGYHLLRFPKLQLTCGPFNYPLLNQAMPLSFSLAAPQAGSLTVKGQISPASLDSSLKLSLRQWDITRFRPYYLKPGDFDVNHGSLDGDANITISKQHLNIPGEIRIKGLELKQGGGRGFFLGLPARAVLAFLKNNKDEIAVQFTLAGDLANPRFQLRQSLVDQIATGVASKIGIPVVSDVARGIMFLGGKGVEGIGKLFGK
jgi:hypothetical protein